MRLHNDTNYDIRVLQQKIIGNLEAIDRVCREHGLRYYLGQAPCLAATKGLFLGMTIWIFAST